MLESGRKFREIFKKESEALAAKELEMKEQEHKGEDKEAGNGVKPGEITEENGKPIEVSIKKVQSLFEFMSNFS